MEIRELRSLVALVESGSLTRVAEHLRLSPAAIHKQLKSLERDLGVQLYEKTGRRLRPTAAAEIVLPYLRDLLAQYEGARSALDEWKGLKKGLVRIGSGPTLSIYALPQLLKRFRRRFAGVDLLVETGQTTGLVAGLTGGALDLALLVSSEAIAEPNLAWHRFWDFECVLVSNLRQAPRRCALGDLKRYPFILYQKGSHLENLIDRYFTERDFRPKVIMRFDHAEAIKAMISTGLGISMLPYWAVEDDIRRGTLRLIRQQEPPLLGKVALVSRKSGYMPRAASEFIGMAHGFEFRNPRLRSWPLLKRPIK